MQKRNQKMDRVKKCIQKMTGRRGLALLLAVTLLVTSVKFDWWSFGAIANFPDAETEPIENMTQTADSASEDGATGGSESDDGTGWVEDALSDADGDGNGNSGSTDESAASGYSVDGDLTDDDSAYGESGSGTADSGNGGEYADGNGSAVSAEDVDSDPAGTSVSDAEQVTADDAVADDTAQAAVGAEEATETQAADSQADADGDKDGQTGEAEQAETAQTDNATAPAGTLDARTQSESVFVEATYDAGVFPAGTTMEAVDVPAADVREVLGDKVKNISDIAAVDIRFYQGNQRIEPDGKVKVELELDEPLNGDDQLLVHIDENNHPYAVGDNSIDELTWENAVFYADDFSVYAIVAVKDEPQTAENVTADKNNAKANAAETAKSDSNKDGAEADNGAAENAASAEDTTDTVDADRITEDANKATTDENTTEDAGKATADEERTDEKTTEDTDEADENTGATDETESQTAAEPEQKSMPEGIRVGSTAGGVHVYTHYGENVFPADAKLNVVDVPKEQVIDAINEAVDGDVVDVAAVDITFTDAEGKELQPNDGGQVEVQLSLDESLESGDEQTVVHIDDNDKVTELSDSAVDVVTEEKAVFVADSFSSYVMITVDKEGKTTEEEYTGKLTSQFGANIQSGGSIAAVLTSDAYNASGATYGEVPKEVTLRYVLNPGETVTPTVSVYLNPSEGTVTSDTKVGEVTGKAVTNPASNTLDWRTVQTIDLSGLNPQKIKATNGDTYSVVVTFALTGNTDRKLQFYTGSGIAESITRTNEETPKDQIKAAAPSYNYYKETSGSSYQKVDSQCLYVTLDKDEIIDDKDITVSLGKKNAVYYAYWDSASNYIPVQLTPTVTPTYSNVTINYTSSNTDVATVDDKGLVTPKQDGITTITAKAGTSGNESEKVTISVLTMSLTETDEQADGTSKGNIHTTNETKHRYYRDRDATNGDAGSVAHEPTPTITDANVPENRGNVSDRFDITYDSSNAGTATVTATGRDQYEGIVATKTFQIEPQRFTAVKKENFKYEIDTSASNSDEVIQSAQIYDDNGMLMIKDTDYTIKAKRKATAGSETDLYRGVPYIISIKAKNNYVNYDAEKEEETPNEWITIEYTLSRTNVDISTVAKIGDIAACTYDGEQQKPKITFVAENSSGETVKLNTTTLKEDGVTPENTDADVVVTYGNNVNAGNSATVTVEGIRKYGNYEGYSGKLSATFTIDRYNIQSDGNAQLVLTTGTTKDGFIKKDGKYYVLHTGNDIAAPTVVTRKDPEEVLTVGTDYTLSYSRDDLSGVGDYTVTVSGTGNYTGVKRVSYTVVPNCALLNEFEVWIGETKCVFGSGVYTSSYRVGYDGNAKEPKITIKAGDDDWTDIFKIDSSNYSNNTEVSTDNKKATITFKDKTYFDDTTCSPEESPTAKATFTIVAEEVKNGFDWQSAYAPTYDGTAKIPSASQFVLSVNGKPLDPEKDYDIEYRHENGKTGADVMVDAGTVTMTAVNRTGSNYHIDTDTPPTLRYEIAARAISDVSVYNTNYISMTSLVMGAGTEAGTAVIGTEYTGSEVSLVNGGRNTSSNAADYWVRYENIYLTEGTDFTVDLGGATAVGGHTMTLKGIGNLSGTKEVPFTIEKRKSVDSIKLVYKGNKYSLNDEGFAEYAGTVLALPYDGHDYWDGGTADADHKITAEVVDNDVTLTTGFDINFSEKREAGTIIATVRGTGSYDYSVTFKYTIIPRDIASDGIEVKDSPSLEDGSPQFDIQDSVRLPSDTDLEYGEEKDYTYTLSDKDGNPVTKIETAGTYTATIKGENNYNGTRTQIITIGKNLADAVVTPVDNTDFKNGTATDDPFTLAYIGETRPEIGKLYDLYMGTTKLTSDTNATEGADYVAPDADSYKVDTTTTAYTNGDTSGYNAGSVVTVTIKAADTSTKYYGEKTFTYTVVPREITDDWANLTIEDVKHAVTNFTQNSGDRSVIVYPYVNQTFSVDVSGEGRTPDLEATYTYSGKEYPISIAAIEEVGHNENASATGTATVAQVDATATGNIYKKDSNRYVAVDSTNTLKYLNVTLSDTNFTGYANVAYYILQIDLSTGGKGEGGSEMNAVNTRYDVAEDHYYTVKATLNDPDEDGSIPYDKEAHTPKYSVKLKAYGFDEVTLWDGESGVLGSASYANANANASATKVDSPTAAGVYDAYVTGKSPGTVNTLTGQKLFEITAVELTSSMKLSSTSTNWTENGSSGSFTYSGSAQYPEVTLTVAAGTKDETIWKYTDISKTEPTWNNDGKYVSQMDAPTVTWPSGSGTSTNKGEYEVTAKFQDSNYVIKGADSDFKAEALTYTKKYEITQITLNATIALSAPDENTNWTADGSSGYFTYTNAEQYPVVTLTVAAGTEDVTTWTYTQGSGTSPTNNGGKYTSTSLMDAPTVTWPTTESKEPNQYEISASFTDNNNIAVELANSSVKYAIKAVLGDGTDKVDGSTITQLGYNNTKFIYRPTAGKWYTYEIGVSSETYNDGNEDKRYPVVNRGEEFTKNTDLKISTAGGTELVNGTNYTVTMTGMDTPGADGYITVTAKGEYYTGSFKIPCTVYADLADATVALANSRDKEVPLNGESNSGTSYTKKPVVTVTWGGNAINSNYYTAVHLYDDGNNGYTTDAKIGEVKVLAESNSTGGADYYLGTASKEALYQVVRRMDGLIVEITLLKEKGNTTKYTKKIIDTYNTEDTRKLDTLTWDDHLLNLKNDTAVLEPKVHYAGDGSSDEDFEEKVNITVSDGTETIGDIKLSKFTKVNTTYTVTVTDDYGQSATGTFKIAPGHLYVTFNYEENEKYVYDGEAHTPEITVENVIGDTMTEGNWYSVAYDNTVKRTNGVPIDAQPVNYTITASGNYEEIYTRNSETDDRSTVSYPKVLGLEYKIVAKNLEDKEGGTVSIADIEEQSYTGKKIEPSLTVTYRTNGQQTLSLTAGTDYTVSYDKNADPGTATVTIEGKGKNYTGTKTAEFTITKLDLSTYTGVLVNQTAIYTGSYLDLTKDILKSSRQDFYLTKAGKKVDDLGIGDFAFEIVGYENINRIIDVGTYDIKVSPNDTTKEKFEKSLNVSFEIEPRSLKWWKSTPQSPSGYVGNPYSFKYDITLAENDNKALIGTDKDGSVCYRVDGEMPYTGGPIEPKVTIVDNKETESTESGTTTIANTTTLDEGVNYTVAYGTDTAAGTNIKSGEDNGFVTITGKGGTTGRYKDSVKVYFSIGTELTETGNNAFSVSLSKDTFEYNGDSQTPSVIVKDKTGNTLTESTDGGVTGDYTVTYPSDTTNVGEDKVITVSGVGKYYGDVEKTYSITPVNLTNYIDSGYLDMTMDSDDIYYVHGTQKEYPAFFYTGSVINPTVSAVQCRTETGTVYELSASDYEAKSAGVINATQISSSDGQPANVPEVTVTIKGNYVYKGTKNPTLPYVVMPHYFDESTDAVSLSTDASTKAGNKYAYNSTYDCYVYQGTPINPFNGVSINNGAAVLPAGSGNYTATIETGTNEWVGDAKIAIAGSRSSSRTALDNTVAQLLKNDDLKVYGGSENFAGTLSGTFKIMGDLSDEKNVVTVDAQEYDENGYDVYYFEDRNGKDIAVTYYDKTLTLVTDYSEDNAASVNQYRLVGDVTSANGFRKSGRLTIGPANGYFFGEKEVTFAITGYTGEDSEIQVFVDPARNAYIPRRNLPDVVVSLNGVTDVTGAAKIAYQKYANGEWGSVKESEVTGVGNYRIYATWMDDDKIAYTNYADYEITPVDIGDESLVTVVPDSIETQAYTGKAIEPGVKSVTYTYTIGDTTRKVTLKEGTDYTVSYANNVNPTSADSPAALTLTGTGNYTGEKVLTFAIEDNKILTSDNVAISPGGYLYDGYPHRPAVTVTYNGKTLAVSADGGETGDYTLTYSSDEKGIYALADDQPTQPGTYYAVVEGTGSEDEDGIVTGYQGLVAVPFTIVDGSIEGTLTVTVDPEETTYNAAVQMPTVTVKKGDTTVEPDSIIYSYEKTGSGRVQVDAPKDAAAYTVWAVYGGETGTATYKINPLSIREAVRNNTITVSGIDDTVAYSKSGAEQTKLKLTYNDGTNSETLAKGEDYTVSYTGNDLPTSNQGATVTVTGNYDSDTGLGNYTGTYSDSYDVQLPIDGLVGIATSASTVRLAWNRTADANGYQVTYKNGSTQYTKTADEGSYSGFDVTGLNADSSITFSVTPYVTTESSTTKMVTGDSDRVTARTLAASSSSSSSSGSGSPSTSSSSSSGSSSSSSGSSSNNRVVYVNRSSDDDDDDDDDDDNSSSSSSGKTTYSERTDKTVFTTSTVGGKKVTKVSLSSNKARQATITWKKNNKFDGVSIFRSSDGGDTYQKVAQVESTNTYTNKKLTSGKTYYYKMRGYVYNSSGKKVTGKMGKARSVTVK